MKTAQEIEFEKNVKLKEKYLKSKSLMPFEQWKVVQGPLDPEKIFAIVVFTIYLVLFTGILLCQVFTGKVW